MARVSKGLSTLHRSPTKPLTNARPTHRLTYTDTGARLFSAERGPRAAAASTTAKAARPNTRASPVSTRMARFLVRASVSSPVSPSSRDVGQKTARARKEAQTAAPAP
jgi:hypothetical protein